MKLRYKWLAACLVAVVFFAWGSGAQAQVPQVISSTQVKYLTGQQLEITASLAEGVEVRNITVYVRSQFDMTNTINGPAVLEPGKAVYRQNLATQPLKAFTNIDYWFSITLADGTRQETERFSFYYDDNRFTWNIKQDGFYRVHWYEGDDRFAQMVLDVAHSSYQNAQTYITYPELDQEIDIYVYANSADLNSLLQFSPATIIGHADSPLSLMIVVIPTGAGDRMEAQKVVAHELVHILLYRKVGSHYPKIPTWLNEGLADLNEGSRSDLYTYLLGLAISEGSLFPMSQLCNGFPSEGNDYWLSYAQSYYFVRYLYQTHGSSSLEALISQYADGIGCEIAPKNVLGMDLTQLDAAWRKQLSQDNPVEVDTFSPVLPWLVVALAALLAPGLLILASVFRLSPQK